MVGYRGTHGGTTMFETWKYYGMTWCHCKNYHEICCLAAKLLRNWEFLLYIITAKFTLFITKFLQILIILLVGYIPQNFIEFIKLSILPQNNCKIYIFQCHILLILLVWFQEISQNLLQELLSLAMPKDQLFFHSTVCIPT